MRSLTFRTGVTVAALVCLCSLFLVATVRSSGVHNNPVGWLSTGKIVETSPPAFKEPTALGGAGTGGIGVKSAAACTGEDGGCYGPANYTLYPSTGCKPGYVNIGGTCNRTSTWINRCSQLGYEYESETCTCHGCPSCNDGFGSPILIDVQGDGFSLTDALGGVSFDLDGDGLRDGISWTAQGSDDAWLALDRNGNGIIESGQELFGDFTVQPPSGTPNGFSALAGYDNLHGGGNNNGMIDAGDAVFPSLRLWQDVNHNGLSEREELRSLSSSDVVSIDLDYKESKRTDEHGNQFRYRGKVRDMKGAKVNRWAWDVFLVSAP